MINQKLQDFEEEVKPLGDIMTQVNDNLWKEQNIMFTGLIITVKTVIISLICCFFLLRFRDTQ